MNDYVRVVGEEQHGTLVLFEQVTGIGLGDSAELAIPPDRQRRVFLFAAGQNIAVSFLEVVVLARADPFAFALGDLCAGFLR